MSIPFKHIQPLIKKIIKLSKTRKKLVRLRIFLIFVFAGFIFFTVFSYSQITEIYERKNELQHVENELNHLKKQAIRFPELKKRMAEANSDISAKALPENANIDSLLQSISLHARDSGLELLLFEQGVGEKEDFYENIPVSIHTSGTFGNIRDFLDKITGMDRIVYVKDIHMKYSEDENMVNLSCTVIAGRFAGLSKVKKQTRRDSEQKFVFHLFFIAFAFIIGILALLNFKIQMLEKEIKYTQRLISRNKKNVCQSNIHDIQAIY